MDSCGSGLGPMADSYENSNEPLVFTKDTDFLSAERLLAFQVVSYI
jgi:hypothetical protein